MWSADFKLMWLAATVISDAYPYAQGTCQLRSANLSDSISGLRGVEEALLDVVSTLRTGCLSGDLCVTPSTTHGDD